MNFGPLFIIGICLSFFVGADIGTDLRNKNYIDQCEEQYKYSRLQCVILLRGGPLLEDNSSKPEKDE